MFSHNLKIAFRNMRKYFNQTLISVISLAVGFTCFALATLWIRYEMTFDSFHKNAEQLYAVYVPSSRAQTGYSRMTTPHMLAAYLKETFFEVARVTSLNPSSRKMTATYDGVEFQMLIVTVDSSFLKMFDVKIISGNTDFLIPRSEKIAITEEKARKLFGNENPIGKTIMRGSTESEICAVVTGMSKQSNYPFDFIQAQTDYSTLPPTVVYHVNTIIELHPEINIEAFEKKLYEHEFPPMFRSSKLVIKPLTKMRYTDHEIEREVKFQHIFVFAISGLLVVLCSLFNYLTLFVSRFRIRQKELALRMVCGASGFSLLKMLSVEFILTLLFAVVLGFMLTQLLHRAFLTLSDIQMNLSDIYLESLMYIGSVILIALLVFWLILFIFRHRNLNLSIRRSNKNLSRKISVVVQLVISVGFAFCTIIIVKQIHFLHHTDDLGFSFKNRGSVLVYGENTDVFADKLRQIPEITEVVHARGLLSILPQSGRSRREITSWDEKLTEDENINLEQMFVSPEFISFYDFRLVSGEMLTEADPESMVLLNESAAKAFGWQEPVGKHFLFLNDRYTVKGVIKHVYNFAPTIQANPVLYLKRPPDSESVITSFPDGTRMYGRLVLFKYHEGMWDSCVEKIEQMKDDFFMETIYNSEEEYNKYLKSENALIKLLSSVSAICILICIFGFVSLVSLTCEERRKSIAIRKVNGATAGDILGMFAKEYFLLLFIGAAIAFPAGYLIMQRWLEHYAIRTNIPAWLYLTIVCVLALVIVICVGWQVYKSSVENPAEVVKSE